MTLFAAARLPREILFGKGQRRALPAIAARHGSRAFICTDERLSQTPEFVEILAGLKVASVETLVYDRTLPDVPRDSVSTCIAEAKAF
ncbi:MAG: iron-containing alcohol dehydrogenase, partial [Mesorhizobium sp.]|nr:iron-containing alcohol dehydrogenase [Mesorhizobium sp.]